MTDRYAALTVVLDQDIREDDAEPLIQAIRMLKGVSDVQPHLADPTLAIAETRARSELREQLGRVLWDWPNLSERERQEILGSVQRTHRQAWST